MRREVKIGLTGIIALVLLFLGIKFLKGVNLLSKSNSYYITFANAKGLTTSSTVYADGYNIGIVDNVAYAGPGKVVVRVSVNSGVRIPHGTTAHLDEAMLGGCTLNMVMGPDPADCFAPGDTIAGSEAQGLMDAAAGVMPQAQTLLAHIDSLVLALNTLAADPNLPAIMQNANTLTDKLNRSADQLNALLAGDVRELTATFNKTGQNLDTLTASLAQLDIQATLAKVDNTISELHTATAKLNSPDNNVGLLLGDTALYSNINSTVSSATSLLEDLKAHPSRYINVSVFGGRKKKD